MSNNNSPILPHFQKVAPQQLSGMANSSMKRCEALNHGKLPPSLPLDKGFDDFTDKFLAGAQEIYNNLAWLEGKGGSRNLWNNILFELHDLIRDPIDPKSIGTSNTKMGTKGKKKKTNQISVQSQPKTRNQIILKPSEAIEIHECDNSADLVLLEEVIELTPRKKLFGAQVQSYQKDSGEGKKHRDALVSDKLEIIESDKSALANDSLIVMEKIPENEEICYDFIARDYLSEESSCFLVKDVGNLELKPNTGTTAPQGLIKTDCVPLSTITDTDKRERTEAKKFVYNYEISLPKVNLLFDIDPLAL